MSRTLKSAKGGAPKGAAPKLPKSNPPKPEMPKSQRLNEIDKAAIATRLLRHAFSTDVAARAQAHAEFADLIYRDIYKPSVRTKMDALPKGWLIECDNISATFDGKYFTEYFSGILCNRITEFHRWDGLEKNPHRMAAKDARGAIKVYEAAHPLTRAYQDLEARDRDLFDRIAQADRQIKAVLSTVTTTHQLRAAWPEAEAFLPETPKTHAPVPALPMAELNTTLRLPPGATTHQPRGDVA